MNTIKILGGFLVITIMINCSRNKLEEKGFSVSPEIATEENDTSNGIAQDSLKLTTRPGSVLLTGIPQYRLTTVYKVNINKRTKTTFIGSNNYYLKYDELREIYKNFMPGLEAVYGYNMVNVSHYDTKIQNRKDFFDSPVLIKTLYYPSFSSDTLNFKPVQRDYYLISVYDADTNKDGLINMKDLRRFYYFDINALGKAPLVPTNYSVQSSEYDSANDFLYVFAKVDTNGNGQIEDSEETQIFWIDLKNPKSTGRQY